MANVKTFDLTVHYMDGTLVTKYNVSRTAVKYFVEWYRENEDVFDITWENH